MGGFPSIVAFNIKKFLFFPINQKGGPEVIRIGKPHGDMILDEDPLGFVQVEFNEHVIELCPSSWTEDVVVGDAHSFLFHVDAGLAGGVGEVDGALADDQSKEAGKQDYLP